MKTGWQVKPLGELCRIRTGKKDVNQGNPDGAYPFFTCAEENTFSDSYSFDTEALLIAGNGDVGRVSYYKGKFEAYQRTYVVSDFAGVLPRFLYLILDGKLRGTVSRQKLGNTMPYIKVGMLSNFPVPIPPLPEQHRIVAILDEAFAGIATATANAERNLNNAREVFDSDLHELFGQKSDSWDERTLGELITLEYGKPLPNDKRSRNGKYPVYGANGEIDRTDDFYFGKPSIIVGRKGSAGEINLTEEKFWALDVTYFVKYDESSLNLYFLYNLLQTLDLPKLAKGVKPGINRNEVYSISVAIPPLPEQHRIVSELDELSAETLKLESIYQQKHTALTELKQSVLHQAFSGQLH